MTTLYANPYDISYTGFYFISLNEFQEKMATAPFEEVKIDYIDGDNPQLFSATCIDQATLNIWFEHLDDIPDDSEASIAIRYLLDAGIDLSESIDRQEEVMIWHGAIEDYAYDLVEQTVIMSQLPDIVRNHISYASIARDLELNGEVAQIEYGIWIVNCWEF